MRFGIISKQLIYVILLLKILDVYPDELLFQVWKNGALIPVMLLL